MFKIESLETLKEKVKQYTVVLIVGVCMLIATVMGSLE